MFQSLHNHILNKIAEEGRKLGAPPIEFPAKQISVTGNDIDVGYGCIFRLQWWIQGILPVSALYLRLPSNAYGVIICPDGTICNREGGLFESPPGLYKIQYVDKQEHFDFTSSVSELTRDGEKLTLRILLRYRVTDPVKAIGIERPVETLFANIETDLAQYIRIHDHNDIADSANNREGSKLFSFFMERHRRRFPLSKAFEITGVELKDFRGDETFLEMRRNARVQDMEKKLLAQTQEIERLKVEYRNEMEKKAAQAESDQQEILRLMHSKDMELESVRASWQIQRDIISNVMRAVEKAFEPGAYPRDISQVKSVLAEIRETIISSPPPVVPESKPTPIESPRSLEKDKIGKLTGTLLNLLEPRK
ncbi:MAG: hypothetical protein HZA15_14660 [Nitrospirae bacterium]|nr:hypothetical protein [Nitrospirota bacterium]